MATAERQQNSQVVQDMLREADETTNESLEATRRIRQLAEESAKVGGETVDALKTQGDQLKRINRNLDNINEDMKQAEKSLTKMEKFCGLFRCPCGKPKNFESTEMYEKASFENDASKKGKKPSGPSAAAVAVGARPNPNDANDDRQYIKSVTHDHREAEMNENISAVADIVGDLKFQALQMSEELTKQEPLLDTIEKKVDSNTNRVEAANIRATKLLK